MQPIFHAELRTEKAGAELWLNDIPVARLVAGGNPYISVPANQYVVDGKNELRLVVNARETPDSPGAKVEARLKSLSPGQFTDDPKAPVLIQLSWSATAGQTQERIIGKQEDLGAQFGSWPWQTAPSLELNADLISEAAGFLSRIAADFAAGNADDLIALADPKFRSAARAWPARDYPALIAQFRQVVARYNATPGWAMEPIDQSNLSLRLAGRGRLIECIGSDWKPAIRSKRISGYPTYFPMFIGRMGGEFRIFA